MTNWSLHLYHHLPGPMRSVAAGVRGLYLRSWRYDSETERLVAEALEREYWSPEKWKTWQEDRLSFVLHRAVTRVPYYRDQWAARRRGGDRASWEYIENWPILGKEPLRENPKRFVADDYNVRRMFHEHTSGTTGKSLDLWWSKETVRSWFALFEARLRSWHGVSRHDRWAILGGQLVAPVHQRRPPFWVWNPALNQLYMSSYHLAPALIPYYLDALVQYRVKYLLGYTSSLYELALEALRLGRSDVKVTVAITNAEPVFDYQRLAIEEAFQCPVRETYGQAEIVGAASECQAGVLHLWPEVAWLEVMDDDKTTTRTAGDFISTGLLNADMPLVRYRVGDRGAILRDTERRLCACGRTLPVLTSLEGRADDVLFARNGRRIGRLDPVFKNNLAVREAQVIQEALDKVRVRYVPTTDFTIETERSITERLKARMGDVKVVLERVDEVPRGVNGKFRAVICNLPPEVRRQVEKTTR
jgi:phenylacetate-CoA ligase